MESSAERISAPTHTFRDLECWKACRVLRRYVFSMVLPRLPASERFRLRDQLTRAARSTTANLAEGYGRFRFLDKARFCGIARGSCYEVIDHIITAQDEEMLDASLADETEKKAYQAIKLVNGYMAYLKRMAAGEEGNG